MGGGSHSHPLLLIANSFFQQAELNTEGFPLLKSCQAVIAKHIQVQIIPSI